ATPAIPPQEEPPIDPDAPDAPTVPVVESYVVQPGDTLSKIAKRLYGDARLWGLIYEANRDKLASPSLIRIGMELLIPARA
ncbi:MAG: LysM peptidoglycan-binding domain-containing protein, partial [Anaerolineae bacterium]|nr:LysM peptidoglycan-binding domain-containing protein [Anaerolineae bacterium]